MKDIDWPWNIYEWLGALFTHTEK